MANLLRFQHKPAGDSSGYPTEAGGLDRHLGALYFPLTA